MNNDLKKLIEDNKLTNLYSHNNFTIKSICEYLDIWKKYSDEEKFKLENLTPNDTYINKHFTYKGNYNPSVNYIEVIRKGVDKIIDKINDHKKITNKDIFIDIGSGHGKLLNHLAIKTNINTLIGIEIIKERYEYSKKITSEINPDKNIFFFNKSIKDFNMLSNATIIFMNNILFDDDIIQFVIENIKHGCHILSMVPIEECKILKDVFYIETSWDPNTKLFYYIK